MTTIANNISKSLELDNSIYFKAQCGCGEDSHTQTLNLDYDKECDILALHVYSTIRTHYNYHSSDNWQEKIKIWFNNKKRWIKQLAILFFTGQIQGENEFIFTTRDQVNDYIAALQYGLSKIDNIEGRK